MELVNHSNDSELPLLCVTSHSVTDLNRLQNKEPFLDKWASSGLSRGHKCGKGFIIVVGFCGPLLRLGSLTVNSVGSESPSLALPLGLQGTVEGTVVIPSLSLEALYGCFIVCVCSPHTEEALQC